MKSQEEILNTIGECVADYLIDKERCGGQVDITRTYVVTLDTESDERITIRFDNKRTRGI